MIYSVNISPVLLWLKSWWVVAVFGVYTNLDSVNREALQVNICVSWMLNCISLRYMVRNFEDEVSKFTRTMWKTIHYIFV